MTAINFGAQLPFGKLRSNKNIQILWRMRQLASSCFCIVGMFTIHLIPSHLHHTSGSTLRRTTAVSWCQFVLLLCLLEEWAWKARRCCSWSSAFCSPQNLWAESWSWVASCAEPWSYNIIQDSPNNKFHSCWGRLGSQCAAAPGDSCHSVWNRQKPWSHKIWVCCENVGC